MKIRARLKELTSTLGTTTVSFETKSDPAEIEKYRDKDLDLEIKPHRKGRSLDANACLWACIHDLAASLGVNNWTMYLMELKAYGKFTTIYVLPEALKGLKEQWRETDVVGKTFVPGEDGSEAEMLIVNCYFGSHLYDSKEFSVLLNGVICDMKSQGLDTPPSEDMKRMIEELEKKEKR